MKTIEKVLKFICLCIGGVVVALILFAAICGDFGFWPKAISGVSLGIIGIISFFSGISEMYKGDYKKLVEGED